MKRLLRYLWASPYSLVGFVLVPFVLMMRGGTQVVDGVLEVQGGPLPFLLGHCTLLRGGVAAITLGHVVLGRDAEALRKTRSHERVHVRQYEIWGPAFVPAYLLAGMWAFVAQSGTYAGNYFERDAWRQVAQAEEPATKSRPGV